MRRLISEAQRLKLKNYKLYKGKKIKDLSDEQKDHLLELLAKKIGLL